MFGLLKRRGKKKAAAASGDHDGDAAMSDAAQAGAGGADGEAAAKAEDDSMDVGLEVAELRFMLQCDAALVDNRKDVLALFMEKVREERMVAYYKAACEDGLVKLDSSLVTEMERANAKRLEELEEKKRDAEENHGEIEVMEALLAIAQFRARTDTKEAALATYEEVAGLKSMSTGQLIDVVLKRIMLGFFWLDMALIKANIEEAEKLMEKGGDWDRRNRLKVYRGMFSMASRDFHKASEDFRSAVATFTSSELCTYEVFIFYTVITSIVALGRVQFKKEIIDSPEVLSVVREVDHLQDFMNTLHGTDYKGFFTSLVKLNPRICTDRYLATHKDWYFREVRVLAYRQFLESYKSVQLPSMAKSFGVSAVFLDAELSHFISSSRLNAKIDKVDGIVETSQPNETNARYQNIIKQGDVLLNRVQLLSRAINV